MRLDVAFLPPRRPEMSRSLYVVIDVLRASSSIIALLELGAARIIPAGTIAQARRLHRLLPDHLLCGERNGLPPAGFHYGNSPRELASAELAGRGVILATTNGTRILSRLAAAPFVLVGALLNRTATAVVALGLASRHGLEVHILCSGEDGGRTFSLEDALGARAIVDAALAARPELEVSDSALLVHQAFLAARGDLHRAVAAAAHARRLVEIGLPGDVEHCSRLDASKLVPYLERDEDGLLALRALGAQSANMPPSTR